jgi:FtsZ-binding cell division protein ZapB
VGSDSWNGVLSKLTVHEEFRALCALSTSGCLSEEERGRLEAHLAVCAECRDSAEEYEAVAGIAMPSLVPDFPSDHLEVRAGWSTETAKQEFFRRLDLQEADGRGGSRRSPPLKPEIARRQHAWQLWPSRVPALLPYAAALALLATAASLGFRMGRHSVAPMSMSQPSVIPEPHGLRDEIASVSRERENLRAQLGERDSAIASLNNKVTRQLEEIQKLKNEGQQLRESSQSVEEEESRTASERDGLSRKLEQVRSDLASMQKDLESLRQQRTNETFRAAELEAQLGKFPEMLKDRDATIEQQRELLARDRDIRDLMGARDLYIGEVIDVGGDGKTKKPFGRVFYTQGKSLIFYAYDLDQQPGLRNASTFQAWGRRGPDLAQATNLGIFYLDSTSHKRWVLKFNDPKSLEQIDAVFVTVEPNGGSRKPSGKQLLFAYLRVEPNHP